MNEFKFSCPHCQQNIQATPEYAGVQINCPSCQALIVVPQPAQATVAPRSKLTKAPSPVHHAATSPAQATAIVRQTKKPRTGLYIWLGVGAAAVVAAIIFVPKAIDKYHEHQAEVEAAKKAAEAPPPPPPDLEADEILRKVGSSYQALTSYKAQGEAIGTIDMSGINPAMTNLARTDSKLAIMLARPNSYRMEWDLKEGKPNAKGVRGAIWSVGQGDYFHFGPTPPQKVKDRETAFTDAGRMSGTIGVALAELFFNDTNSLATVVKDYAKTNNEIIEGRKCYVLTGTVAFQKMMFWIHKDDFMIAQMEVILGGKLDDAAMAGLSPLEKTQMKMVEKIKGTIIETYENIETNIVLNPDVFQKTLAVNPPAKRKQPKEPKPPGARAKLQ